MAPEPTKVRCPKCGGLISVEPEWRIVQCPACGTPVTRMGVDPSYD